MQKKLILLLFFLGFGLSLKAQIFGSPVSTRNTLYHKCVYAGTQCAAKGKHHTGHDYIGKYGDPIYAVADGKIVKLERMHSRDHGMGNNIIIEHTLSNGQKIYSSYSHLHSFVSGMRVGKTVKKRQQIGGMGSSGYGKLYYWAASNRNAHLHFEIKQKAISGAPWGGTYWGYTPKHPNTYGYYDPAKFIGKIEYKRLSNSGNNNNNNNSNNNTSNKWKTNCGTFTKGVVGLKASNNASSANFVILKANRGKFRQGGRLIITEGSICGRIINTVSYNAGNKYIMRKIRVSTGKTYYAYLKSSNGVMYYAGKFKAK